MRVHIQAVNFNIDKKLVELIEKKVNTLEKFYDNIIEAHVYLKVLKTSLKENKELEVKLSVPGDDPFVKKTSNTFEDALLQSVTTMKKNLMKLKEKQREKYN